MCTFHDTSVVNGATKASFDRLNNTSPPRPQGRLLPEMILVCNFIRNDLQHPNEYVRGCTLRFVCKVKEMELIEPLTDSILTNLDNRHSYVRRNAILAVFTVFQRFPHLLPDGPEVCLFVLRR